MFEKLWTSIKLWYLDHTAHAWVEHHFLYFAILGGVVIVVLIVLTVIRIQKDIKKMNNNSRKSAVDYMRETSPNKKKERKRLKF